MKGFQRTIEDYLNAMAQEDPSFAEKLSSKKMEDCITYILNQVKNSGLQGFDDDEIYGLAVHFFMEDGIDPGTPIQCQVIVNHHVQLTEDEIAEQRRKAKEKVFSDEMARLRNVGKVPSPVKPVKEEEPELTLFS